MLSTSNLAAPDTVVTDPRANGTKIDALLDAEAGHADLYRTAVAGPSGQSARIHVGRIRYRAYGHDEFSIIEPRDGRTVGRARWVHHDGTWWWSITNEDPYTGELEWQGYAETLSVGVDWCVNGLHAATGRHDSRRISQSAIRTADQAIARNNQRHRDECGPCDAAGQSDGYIGCVLR